jgi:hypothetical protein
MSPATVVRVVLVGFTLLVYWRATGFGFVDFDDDVYVRDNAMVRAGLTPQSIRWAFVQTIKTDQGEQLFFTDHAGNWHPLTWLSLMLDAQVYGGDGLHAGGYHLTNLLLHAISVLLLFEVLRGMTGTTWRSALVACLLALHPIHVESVAWIAERKDVLSMLFWLLTMQAYVWWVRRGGVGRYLLAAVLLACGLMSKPWRSRCLSRCCFWTTGRCGASKATATSARSGPRLGGWQSRKFQCS